MDEDQARWTPDGRLLPILGIINHITEVEYRWINGRYLREGMNENGSRIGQPPPGGSAAHSTKGAQSAPGKPAFRLPP